MGPPVWAELQNLPGGLRRVLVGRDGGGCGKGPGKATGMAPDVTPTRVALVTVHVFSTVVSGVLSPEGMLWAVILCKGDASTSRRCSALAQPCRRMLVSVPGASCPQGKTVSCHRGSCKHLDDLVVTVLTAQNVLSPPASRVSW